MLDVILSLLGFLLVAGVIGCVFGLPIWAFVRTRELPRLRARVEQLEREVGRLRRRGVEPAAAPAPVMAPPPHEEEILTAIPVARHRRLLAVPRADAATLEAWIGRQGLGWAAVVLLLFAAAFFLKHAFENAWIGELGRVSLGILAGAGLCLAGYGYYRRGWRLFSQMLTSAGVVLLYLATFGAFGYYHLLPQERAAGFLVALVAEAGALALLYDAPAIAIMAVVGGLLNPVLLHTDRDQYRSLFTYLVVLDTGVVVLSLCRRWPALATVALAGTQALFWAWYTEHYHPEKLTAALLFQCVVFALFLAHHAAVPLLRLRRLNAEGLIGVVLNAFLFAAAGYVLLNEDYHVWMGSLAVGMAIVYTALAWLALRRHPDDTTHVAVLVATALAFVAAVFPLQTEAGWIGVGWAAEGAALWWFGLRVRSRPLGVLGAVLLVLAVGRLLFVDTPWDFREPFVPIFNGYALPALAIAACVLAAAAAARRFHRLPGDLDDVERVAGMTGIVLVWLILSLETYQYFTAQGGPYAEDSYRRTARMSLSVLWAAYAALVLVLGFRLRSRPLRWSALGLFGLTLGKVVLVDMAGLAGFYRVAAFFALSVMMGAAAWGYQKLGAARLAADREELGHDKK